MRNEATAGRSACAATGLAFRAGRPAAGYDITRPATEERCWLLGGRGGGHKDAVRERGERPVDLTADAVAIAVTFIIH